MKNLTKGTIAAVGAGVLLLGGAGTIAYWTDTAAVDGGSVITGTLALGEPDCDEDWVYAEGNAGAGDAVALIVPGDSIAKECSFAITATGDNLTATLTTPESVGIAPDDEAAESFDATVEAAFAIAGDVVPDVITSANDGQIVTATVTVTFPFGTDDDGAPAVNANDTQGVTAALDEIAVTLTQTES